MERKNLWQTYSEAQIRELEEVNAQYRTCLDEGKTERECVKKTIELAEAEGYRNMKDLIKAGTKIHAGDKVYMDYMGKAVVLFQAGTAPVEEGMNILGAHIDSPRIDVKQNPLYENEGLAYLDTHYYGGVKKYQWLAEKTCRSLTSYGDLNYFTPEHAPEGCTGRCLEGCKAKEKCIFDAEKIYLEHERIGYRQGNRGWPLDVLVPSGPTEEKLIEALKTGPYGKCVFHCNNNVVDHQVVNLNMTDGTTMSFTMCGFTAETSRYAKFMGTRGEVIVDMQPDEKESKIVIEYFDPGRTKEVIDVAALSDDFSGHGGGDNKMVEEFLDIISGEKTESTYITSLDRSLQSHYCALAAEYSRLHDGKAVEIDTFR